MSCLEHMLAPDKVSNIETDFYSVFFRCVHFYQKIMFSEILEHCRCPCALYSSVFHKFFFSFRLHSTLCVCYMHIHNSLAFLSPSLHPYGRYENMIRNKKYDAFASQPLQYYETFKCMFMFDIKICIFNDIKLINKIITSKIAKMQTISFAYALCYVCTMYNVQCTLCKCLCRMYGINAAINI